MRRRLLLQLCLLAPVAAAAGRRRDNPEACQRLDARLRAIESQRRAGYTAKQGRQLQAKREELARKRREECG
jgi:hypothetical protein